MGLLSKAADFFGGSLFGEAKELIQSYFPPDMSPTQKAELQQKLEELELKKQDQLNKNLADAERSLNERIVQQEGTASDLKSIPFLGPIVLFLRGLQRPAWGFFCMYIDFVWFTTPSSTMGAIVGGGIGPIPLYTEQQQTALIVINILVLGFLFGERTIKNLTPLIIQVFGKKS